MKTIVEMLLGALLVTIQTGVAIAGAVVGMYLGIALLFVFPAPVTAWMHENWLYVRNDLTIPWEFAFGMFGAGFGAIVALRLLKRPLRRWSGEEVPK